MAARYKEQRAVVAHEETLQVIEPCRSLRPSPQIEADLALGGRSGVRTGEAKIDALSLFRHGRKAQYQRSIDRNRVRLGVIDMT